ncbi:hypothetical protein [Streptomyces sp. NRRL S-474]|uniref:hypothetical protein n=1 Tax=Streptomyces sp. NRRL S-474 TaxID=1463909 RepID=UPI0004C8F804|nr:hypothetical protein [Streptomyces sp. NRRL S-474]
MPEDRIKEYMTERWSEHCKDDQKRSARALNRLEGKSGAGLIKSITNEFDRHIDALRNTRDMILPGLKK